MKILSVIIPSYNVEKYLSCTIESFLPCKKFNELELIVVNDGSTDKTNEIVQAYIRNFPQSIILIDKANGGHGSAINSGLKIAKGRYLTVVDGDDWVDSIAIDNIIDILTNIDVDVSVSGHYRNYMSDDSEEHRNYNEPKGKIVDIAYLLDRHYQIPMTDICYRTQLLRDINLKIQENTFYVDEEFCTIPFVKVNTIVFTGESYYHYRLGNVGQSVSPEKMIKLIDHRLRVFNKLFAFYSSIEMSDSSREYFTRRILAVINTLFLIFYIYIADRKEGKRMGEEFYRNIQEKSIALAIRCKKKHDFMLLMNNFYVTNRVYNLIKRNKK